MKSQPTTTLEEHAVSKLEEEFPETHADTVRVVWWDDGFWPSVGRCGEWA